MFTYFFLALLLEEDLHASVGLCLSAPGWEWMYTGLSLRVSLGGNAYLHFAGEQMQA